MAATIDPRFQSEHRSNVQPEVQSQKYLDWNCKRERPAQGPDWNNDWTSDWNQTACPSRSACSTTRLSSTPDIHVDRVVKWTVIKAGGAPCDPDDDRGGVNPAPGGSQP